MLESEQQLAIGLMVDDARGIGTQRANRSIGEQVQEQSIVLDKEKAKFQPINL